MTEIDNIANELSKVKLSDQINDKDQIPSLLNALFTNTSQTAQLVKSISHLPDSLLTTLFKLQIRNIVDMRSFIGAVSDIDDLELINDVIAIIQKDDLLINNLLKVNKDLIVDGDEFQIRLFLAVITNFNVINKSYFVTLSVILPLLVKLECKSLVLLVIIKLNEIDSQQLELTVLSYLEDTLLLDRQVVLIQNLTVLYPVLPFISTFINTNESFKNLLANLSFNSSEVMVRSVLELFSISCIDEQMRALILLNYYELMWNTKLNHSLNLLKNLVITKVWNYTDKKHGLSSINESFMDVVIENSTGQDLDVAIEGLLYLSLQISLKESMRSNVVFIEKLITLIESNENSIRFGVLNILTNLTQYEDKKQSIGSHIFNKSEISDNESQIDSFIKSVLDKINALITKRIPTLTTSINLQIIKLLYNITYKRVNRSKPIIETTLSFLLQFLTVVSSKDLQYEPGTFTIKNPELVRYPEERLLLIKTVLQLLMSTDPNTIFPNPEKKQQLRTCVPFLCELLVGDVEDKYKFNSLVSLINLSSMPDDVVTKNLIIKVLFVPCQDLIISSNTQLCRTAIELVANLSVSPVLLQKFFDIDDLSSIKNYQIMLNLLNHVDTEIQILALNFFANVSEYELISLILLDDERFMDLIIAFTQVDEFITNDEFIIRVTYILSNLAQATIVDDKVDEKKVVLLRRDDLKKGILKILESVKDEEILSNCVNLCNIIKF